MMETTSQKVDIQQVKSVVSTSFPELWLQTEACLSTMVTLLLKNNSNPTALVLLGKASAGKSTVLKFFRGMDELVYSSDNFSPKALLTQYANKDKKALEEVDMLTRIQKKCFIVFDLGPIFSKRFEDLKDTLSVLTRALDGDGLSMDGGVHGQRKLTGDYMFAMLGASIPFAYKVWDVTASLGSRLLFLNMPNIEYGDDEIIADYLGGIPYKQKVEICNEAMKQFVPSLFKEKGGFRAIDWEDKNIPMDVLKAASFFAKLLVRLRGKAPCMYEDRDGNFEHQEVSIECPKRAMALLLNLAKGRAIIYGRNQVTIEDISLLREVVLSSGPQDRGKIMRELINRPSHSMSKEDVSILLKGGEKMTKLAMVNLEVLELATSGKLHGEGRGRPGNTITLCENMVKNIDLLRG